MDYYVLDTETAYCSKTKYSLRSMTTEEYINDPRFHLFGFSIKKNGGKSLWVPEEKVDMFLRQLKLHEHAVIMHNAQFDAAILSWKYGVKPKLIIDTLSMARGILGNEERLSLEALGERYGIGKKGDTVLHMDGVRHPSPQMARKLGEYACNDADMTWNLWLKLKEGFPRLELFVVDITTRMFSEPSFVLDKKPILRELEVGEEKKKRLLEQANCTMEDLRSDAKFAILLENLGVVPPKKLSVKKSEKAKQGDPNASPVYTWAFAKSDADFKALGEHDDELVRWAVEARLGLKSTIKQSRAERFLGIAERMGVLPVALTYYGAGCVTGDTEVLTRAGWERIDGWNGGDIAQYSHDGGVVFDEAQKFVGAPVTEWVEVDAPYVKASLTLGHTVPYLTHDSKRFATLAAGNLHSRSSTLVPVAGVLQYEGAITVPQMRVLVMVQADGSFEINTRQGRSLRINVKKPRKIARCRELLCDAGILFREQSFASRPGYVRFSVKHADWPSWLSPERKFFGGWLTDSTQEAREAVFDEITHWDGWTQGGQTCYSTSDYVNVEWIVTLAHLCGRAASTSTKKARGNRRPNYAIRFRQRSYAKISQKDVRTVITPPTPVYCTITKTGFWLARSGGRIFVTGNTGRYAASSSAKINMQNLPAVRGSKDPDAGLLRKALCAPKGQVIVVSDASQIEARLLAWQAGQANVVEAFAQGRDVYAEMATTVFGRPIDKNIDYVERFIGKAIVLGCGYQLGHVKFASMIHAGMLGGPSILFDGKMAESLNVNAEQYAIYLRKQKDMLDRLKEMKPAGLDATQWVRHAACAKKIIDVFREKNAGITGFWKTCDRMLDAMYRGTEEKIGLFETTKNGFMLPNGMWLHFKELEKDREGYSCLRKKEGRVKRVKVYPGSVAENGTQALAGAYVKEAMVRMHLKGHRPILQVHDEVVCLADEGDAERVLREVNECMETVPSWAVGLPLAAEGDFARSYGDAK